MLVWVGPGDDFALTVILVDIQHNKDLGRMLVVQRVKMGLCRQRVHMRKRTERIGFCCYLSRSEIVRSFGGESYFWRVGRLSR